MTVHSGVWSAPGRVNLIGEHTDYNDGYALPLALPHRTVVSGQLRAGPTRWSVTTSSAPDPVVIEPADLTPGRVPGWAGYVAGVIWALTETGHTVPAADLTIDSDVPIGAGLSSSAALECAVLTALCDLGDIDLSLIDRARLAQRAENGYVGVPCGIMDQAAATLCRSGHALFLDCRTLHVAHVPFDVGASGLRLVVIDSRTPHAHVDNEYAQRRRTCQAAAQHLGLPALRDIVDLDQALAALPDPTMRLRVRHVVTENQRVLDTVEALREGRLRDVGPYLTASHGSMRDDYEITVAPVDLIVATALAVGAYGARMTGGGFGGCVLALIDADRGDELSAAVTRAAAAHGFPEPVSWSVQPGAGATASARR